MSQSTATCPALADSHNDDKCTENFAGISSVVYVCLKSDIAAPITRPDNTYATPVFKSGNGFYKIDLNDGDHKIEDKSQGNNKGLKLTYYIE